MTTGRAAPPPGLPPRAPSDAGEAARARALALCARADVAVDRASALRTARRTLGEATRTALERATALRALGAARRRPWLDGPDVHAARREAGRIVRRSARRARVAASAAPPPDDPSDAEGSVAARWAQATVYASRTVRGIDAGVASDGLLGAPAAAGTWTVREVDAGAMPGARGARCLVFEHHGLVRRVWDFPGTWLTLPASALLRLAGLHP